MSDGSLQYERTDAATVAPAAAVQSLWQRVLREPAQGTDTMDNVGVAIRAMAIAFAVFMAFGSAEMRHVARNLPGSTLSDVLVEAADRWHIMMQHLGPAHVEPVVRNAFDSLRDKRWSS
jgi:hypothetical protein